MQRESPGSRRPKEAWMSESKVKTLLIRLTAKLQCNASLFHLVRLPTRSLCPNFGTFETVGSSCQAKLVRRRVNPPIWEDALSYSVFSQGILAEKSIVVLDRSVGSPDLAPCAFFLVPVMQNRLKRPHFETAEEIKKVTAAVLNNLRENYFCGSKVWN
jgi:hypothetical protein